MLARFNAALRGTPDVALTWALLAIGVVTIAVALSASPVVKAALASWELLP